MTSLYGPGPCAWQQKDLENEVLTILNEGLCPMDVAMSLIDHDVAAGEYAGCSGTLEIQYSIYETLAQRLLRETTTNEE